MTTPDKPELFDSPPPKKPHRGRPSGSTKAALQAIEEMTAAGDKITEKTVAKRAGIHHRTAGQALAVYAARQEAGAAAAARLGEAAALAGLSPKSKMTIKKATEIYKRRLEKSFWSTVEAQVRKEIAKADEGVRKTLAKLQTEQRFWRTEAAKRGVFTRQEYRQLLMCTHPDAPASPEMRARLTDILIRNEMKLIKEVD